jgi:hypothetical protein
MSLLLPQERAGTVRAMRPVDIHGDRYVDLSVELDEAAGSTTPSTGRISAGECPADLAPGDRVSVRFVMGVMVRVSRTPAAAG